MQSAPRVAAEQPAKQNPFIHSASSVERPAQPTAHTESPSSAEPSVPAPEPPIEVAPVPLPPAVSPVEASPISEPRAAYFGPGAPPEDANPIVRPEPGYVSPNPPRVAEREPASPVAPPVAVAAPIVPAEPVVTSPFLPALVEPSAVVEWPKKELEPPSVEAKPSNEPVPALESQLTSTADPPVVHEPKVEPHVHANAFETAPTEVAAQETPISVSEPDATSETASTEAAASSAAPTAEVSAPEAAAAVIAAEDTSAPANPESVVMEAEIQEHATVTAQPFPAPRSFTSSGSEMPVVITTPTPPRAQDTAAPSAKLFELGRELLPKAEAWSRKNLRATPRALVIALPLIALFGIWAVRSLGSHPKHADVEAKSNVVAEVAAATPAADSTGEKTAPEASAILVSTAAPAPAAPPGADAAELADAVSHGLPALEALARKFPSDAQVSVTLASEQARAQRFEAAVESVERAIAADAKIAQNGKVMGILWRAAQSSATEPSFAALRKLGAKGSDIAFDLATTSGVRESVRERAKTELKSLSADASADTRVAAELLLASDCDARKALLSRAEREGGKRTQSLLEQYSRGSTCTSSTDKSCNACLTGSSELTHALAQLNAGGSK